MTSTYTEVNKHKFIILSAKEELKTKLRNVSLGGYVTRNLGSCLAAHVLGNCLALSGYACFENNTQLFGALAFLIKGSSPYQLHASFGYDVVAFSKSPSKPFTITTAIATLALPPCACG
jgi:hypothetical protein